LALAAFLQYGSRHGSFKLKPKFKRYYFLIGACFHFTIWLNRGIFKLKQV